MNRFALAAALVLFGAAPVSAGLSKTQTTAKHSPSRQNSKLSSEALGGFNRGDPKNPYWEPCLSYVEAGVPVLAVGKLPLSRDAGLPP
jgi:hypothetical protein